MFTGKTYCVKAMIYKRQYKIDVHVTPFFSKLEVKKRSAVTRFSTFIVSVLYDATLHSYDPTQWRSWVWSESIRAETFNQKKSVKQSFTLVSNDWDISSKEYSRHLYLFFWCKCEYTSHAS